MNIIDFLNSLISFPAEYQFLLFLIAGVIVIVSVVMFNGLIIGLISSLFNRR